MDQKEGKDYFFVRSSRADLGDMSGDISQIYCYEPEEELEQESDDDDRY